MADSLIESVKIIFKWILYILFFDLRIMEDIIENFLIRLLLLAIIYFLIYNFYKTNKIVRNFFIFWVIVRPIILIIFIIYLLWILGYGYVGNVTFN